MSEPPDLCREALETSIRCSLPNVLSDDVHLQDWAVFYKGLNLFSNIWANLEDCTANDVQTVDRFWVHGVFPGLSDRHRTRERHIH